MSHFPMPVEGPAPRIDTTTAHAARIYDYFLGGKTHYAVDREVAEQLLRIRPYVPASAQSNRAFMHRSTRVLAEEYGVRQFWDIGTGIPTEPNLHQVAQQVAPGARVAYMDHDPIVLTTAQDLVDSAPGVAYLLADFHEPERMLEAARDHLDFRRPIALSLISLLHFVPDAAGPQDIVDQLVGELPSGSFLTLSLVTGDFDPEGIAEGTAAYHAQGIPFQARTAEETLRFFDGLELLDPGLARAHTWRPDPDKPEPLTDRTAPGHAAVARKP